MFTQRPEITDDATAHRILGISLDDYAAADICFEGAAYAEFVRRHDLRKNGRNRRMAIKAIQELREEGVESWIRDQETPEPLQKDSNTKAICMILQSFDDDWQTMSIEYREAIKRVVRKQWPDVMSDFWKWHHNHFLIRAESLRRDPDEGDDAIAADYLIMAENEVDEIYNELYDEWFDELANKHAEELEVEAQKTLSPKERKLRLREEACKAVDQRQKENGGNVKRACEEVMHTMWMELHRAGWRWAGMENLRQEYCKWRRARIRGR